MRFIEDKDVEKLSGISQKSIRALEARRLGIFKNNNGDYIIIRESGLGSGIDKVFRTTAELNAFIDKKFWR